MEPDSTQDIDPSIRVIFRREDGGVAVVIPSPGTGLTLDQVIAGAVPAGAPYKIVTVADIPTNRTFRAAWEWVD